MWQAKLEITYIEFARVEVGVGLVTLTALDVEAKAQVIVTVNDVVGVYHVHTYNHDV